VAGICIVAVSRLTCSIACDSAHAGRRSKEIVTEGSWPWCVIDSGPTL
jgi:hypothetical protein